MKRASKAAHLKGFTLLEVMVVLAIMGVLLGMASLSFDQRKTLDDSKEFAQSLRLYMNALRDEASFQNLDLGLLMDVKEIQLLSYTPPKLKKPTKDGSKNDSNSGFAQNAAAQPEEEEEKSPWQDYQGRLKKQIKTPEGIFLRLELEGRELDFNQQINNKERNPALLFLSSDEYTPFTLHIEHEDDQGFSVTLSGDGLSAFDVQTEVFDE